MTLLRDLASLPGISDLCAVDDVEHEDHLFSASATVGLDTWYPGLWGTARKRVRRFDVAYLRDQIYLNPHPKELMLRNHV